MQVKQTTKYTTDPLSFACLEFYRGLKEIQ